MLKIHALFFSLALGTGMCSAAAQGKEVACSAVQKNHVAWANQRAKEVRSDDELFRRLSRSQGQPAQCSVLDVVRYEGQYFGKIQFRWPSGLAYTVASAPPESGEVSIDIPAAASDGKDLVDHLRNDVKQRGFSLNWDRPVITSEGNGTVTEYSGNDSGDNVFFRVRHNKQKKLIGVSFSYAL